MHKIGDWLILLLYVAILYLLVRPGSQGPKLVSTVTSGIANLVSTATGGSDWSGR